MKADFYLKILQVDTDRALYRRKEFKNKNKNRKPCGIEKIMNPKSYEIWD